jgi:thioredoxin
MPFAAAGSRSQAVRAEGRHFVDRQEILMELVARFALAACAAFSLVGVVHAAEFREFDSNAFAAAQAAGEPVLVDVHAWWCPVCASQSRTIRKITAAPQYDRLIVFQLNYDKQKDEWRRLGVSRQGTLIGYHGQTETGRLAFQTDAGKIGALLDSMVR